MNTYENPMAAFIAERLRAITAKIIDFDVARIKDNVEFYHYGITSVTILEMANLLSADFAGIRQTAFFEYPTIQGLADYLAADHSEAIAAVMNSGSIDGSSPPKRVRFLPSNRTAAVLSSEDVPTSESVSPVGTLTTSSDEQIAEPTGKPIIRPNVGHSHDIAIIGVSVRLPQAKDIFEFWDNLKSGKNCLSQIPRHRWDVLRALKQVDQLPGEQYPWGGFIDEIEYFDPLHFGLSPVNALLTDPQARLMLQAAWHTFEDAGLTPAQLRGSKTGVFIGMNYDHWATVIYDLLGATGSPTSQSETVNQISSYFGLEGPSLALTNHCASAITGLHMACNSIRAGDCSMALVGGVNLLLRPDKNAAYASAGTPVGNDDRVHSFGRGGSGLVIGEGVGALLLKPMDAAIRDGDNIYASIKGSTAVHTGAPMFINPPVPISAKVTRDLLAKADIDPATISYLETGSLGINLVDTMDLAALNIAFAQLPPHSCAIGSVKSNIGHVEAASGIAALAKTILQLRHQTLVPSLNGEDLIASVDWDNSQFVVQRELGFWPERTAKTGDVQQTLPRRAMVFTAGVGGSMAHAIVEEFTEPTMPKDVPGDHVFVLSARTPEQLRQYAASYVSFLDDPARIASLQQMAYTMQTGRTPMAIRLACVAGDIATLRTQLSSFAEGTEITPASGTYTSATSTTLPMTLLSGTAGDEFVRALCSAADWHNVAQLWVAGLDIDWARIYVSKPRRISLPIYPFAKQLLWLDELKALASGQPLPFNVDEGFFKIANDLLKKQIALEETV